MSKKSSHVVATVILILTFSPVFADSGSVTVPTSSIMEIMLSIIAPATDVLWGADDPKSDEDWKVLENAAVAVINAGELIKQGGTGPQDNTWAGQAEWQGFSLLMTDAAEQAFDAIRNKDLDALFEAGDNLYPPCESCHLQYNPALVKE